MQLVIRRYRPSDKDPVLDLFGVGIREHINPCFYNAMTTPVHLSVTVALCLAGYLLGSLLGAVLFLSVWVAVVYYCCYTLYDGYVRLRLKTDMQDIVGNYLSRADDCFWVAEAEVEGRPQLVGMVAVMAKEKGKEKYGELFRMIISPQCRRMGLGSRLTQTVVDFCRERGFSKVALETSSTQAAAVALYNKLGFRLVATVTTGELPSWVIWFSRVTILKMEKDL